MVDEDAGLVERVEELAEEWFGKEVLRIHLHNDVDDGPARARARAGTARPSSAAARPSSAAAPPVVRRGPATYP